MLPRRKRNTEDQGSQKEDKNNKNIQNQAPLNTILTFLLKKATVTRPHRRLHPATMLPMLSKPLSPYDRLSSKGMLTQYKLDLG